MIARDRLIFEKVVGSHAYGTAHEESNLDIKGIYVDPKNAFLTLDDIPLQINDDKNDIVYYSVRRFLQLALDANPNIIELMFMPEDCVRLCTEAAKSSNQSKEDFLLRMEKNGFGYLIHQHVDAARSKVRKKNKQKHF